LVLDLTSNGVDNDGAELLGKALANNRKLTEINLTSNRVGSIGVTTLFKYIAKNETLKVIRVRKLKLVSFLDLQLNCFLFSVTMIFLKGTSLSTFCFNFLHRSAGVLKSEI
jgi:Ran GTPase-activating protein (RanGAP) involved in mRNA processing and transport